MFVCFQSFTVHPPYRIVLLLQQIFSFLVCLIKCKSQRATNQKHEFLAALDSEHWLIGVKASCGLVERRKSGGGYAKDRILWTLVFSTQRLYVWILNIIVEVVITTYYIHSVEQMRKMMGMGECCNRRNHTLMRLHIQLQVEKKTVIESFVSLS